MYDMSSIIRHGPFPTAHVRTTDLSCSVLFYPLTGLRSEQGWGGGLKMVTEEFLLLITKRVPTTLCKHKTLHLNEGILPEGGDVTVALWTP